MIIVSMGIFLLTFFFKLLFLYSEGVIIHAYKNDTLIDYLHIFCFPLQIYYITSIIKCLPHTDVILFPKRDCPASKNVLSTSGHVTMSDSLSSYLLWILPSCYVNSLCSAKSFLFTYPCCGLSSNYVRYLL